MPPGWSFGRPRPVMAAARGVKPIRLGIWETGRPEGAGPEATGAHVAPGLTPEAGGQLRAGGGAGAWARPGVEGVPGARPV